MPGGDSDAVLRDQETGNGADAAGTGSLPIDVDAGQHVGQRVDVVLPPNHQVHCPLVAEEQAAYTPPLPGLPQPEEVATAADAAPAPAARQAAAGDAFAQFEDETETAAIAEAEEEEEAEQASASPMPPTWRRRPTTTTGQYITEKQSIFQQFASPFRQLAGSAANQRRAGLQCRVARAHSLDWPAGQRRRLHRPPAATTTILSIPLA